MPSTRRSNISLSVRSPMMPVAPALSRRKPAMNVCVFQRPLGAWSISRVPEGAHPASLVMLFFSFRDVSSVKTDRSRRSRVKGRARAIQIARSRATSGRFQSLARSSFLRDRPSRCGNRRIDALNVDIALLPQRRDRLFERRIRLVLDLSRTPIMNAGRFAVAAPALRPGFGRAGLRLQPDHVVDELDRDPETRRRSPVRSVFPDQAHQARSQFHRTRLARNASPSCSRSGNRGLPARWFPGFLTRVSPAPLHWPVPSMYSTGFDSGFPLMPEHCGRPNAPAGRSTHAPRLFKAGRIIQTATLIAELVPEVRPAPAAGERQSGA